MTGRSCLAGPASRGTSGQVALFRCVGRGLARTATISGRRFRSDPSIVIRTACSPTTFRFRFHRSMAMLRTMSFGSAGPCATTLPEALVTSVPSGAVTTNPRSCSRLRSTEVSRRPTTREMCGCTNGMDGPGQPRDPTAQDVELLTGLDFGGIRQERVLDLRHASSRRLRYAVYW